MEYNIIPPSNTKVVSEEENKGVYEIDGLYPGYGHTLGNSLRRILLSSLPGAAVTKVKIEGASHEFATLPGVLEDIITILLDIKQLRFKLHTDEPQVATLDVKGAREVKGKDIKCPTQLEVISREQHIGTITDKNTRFQAELTVERGLGFVPAESLVKEKVSVGTLVLDAIFTPIRRANYEVENMRVGDRTDFNRLRIFIETDGSLSPREALRQALAIMKEQLDHLATFESNGNRKFEEGGEELIQETIGDEFLDLKLSARVKNVLKASGVQSAAELSQKSKEELLAVEGIGEKAVSEIKKALAKLGLSLRE